MTNKERIAQLRTECPTINLTRKTSTDEWVVNYRPEYGGTPDSRYYADSLDDACDTARAMHAQKHPTPTHPRLQTAHGYRLTRADDREDLGIAFTLKAARAFAQEYSRREECTVDVEAGMENGWTLIETWTDGRYSCV